MPPIKVPTVPVTDVLRQPGVELSTEATKYIGTKPYVDATKELVRLAEAGGSESRVDIELPDGSGLIMTCRDGIPTVRYEPPPNPPGAGQVPV